MKKCVCGNNLKDIPTGYYCDNCKEEWMSNKKNKKLTNKRKNVKKK